MKDAKARLLIVDDELPSRTSLSQLCINSGYSVRSADDGFSALLQIRERVPDILLSDLNMSGMSGFELMSIVRRRFPVMQVIAMSGSPSEYGIPPGVAADAFYAKGSDPRLLLQVMRALPQAPRALPQYSTMSAPIWISRSEQEHSGHLHITITCPECLRAFLVVLDDGICHIHEADCVHCHSLIYYAIVQPAIRLPLQTTQDDFCERQQAPSLSHYYY